jgi:glutaminase
METNTMESMGHMEHKEHYLVQYFSYCHLSDELQQIVRPFCELAYEMNCKLPHNPLLTHVLQNLLEAKDAAIRAVEFK